MSGATIVVRRVAAIPARESADTWRAIVGLLAAPGSVAQQELYAVTNIASVLISEEYTGQAPIVVRADTGPRVRVYTVHGPDAIDGQTVEESQLATWPTTQDGWSVSLPCGVDDLDEMRQAIAPHPCVTVRDMTDDVLA